MPIENYTNNTEILRQDLINIKGLISYIIRESILGKTDPAILSLQRIVRFMEKFDDNDQIVTAFTLYEQLETLQNKISSTFGANKLVSADNITIILNEIVGYLYKSLDYNTRSGNDEEIND